MSFDRPQFKDLIERTLASVDPKLNTPAAVNLLLGTAAVESDFGTYLRQRGGGPALGVFQMEPQTFAWLQAHYAPYSPWDSDELEYDLRLAIIFARLRYRIVKEPLPDAEDVEAMGRYWKKHYNTEAGAGTVEKFLEKYERYVA